MFLYHQQKVNIILVCILWFIIATQNNSQSIQFHHLTVNDGLSNNKVNTVIQDHTGFIWIGTKDGLSRYDGNKFKVFRSNPLDSVSISNNEIWALMEDHRGYIWVGTVDGILNQFDPETEIFIRWDIVNSINESTSITALFEDSKYNIWIGTRAKGVFRWNPLTQNIANYDRIRSDSTTLSHPSVRAVSEDGNGNIIIGTYHGLNKFNPNLPGTPFQRFFHSQDDQSSIIHDQVYNLTRSQTNPDIIWIGTPAGLSQFNSNDNSFHNIKIPNPHNLQFGSGASTVIEESYLGDEILWTDTYGGLVRLNLSTGKAYRFTNDETNPASLLDSRINKIMKDNTGVIWIATESGISSLSAKSIKFNSPFNQAYSTFLNEAEGKKNLNAIYENNGDVVLGFSNGIIKMHPLKLSNKYVKLFELNKFNVWSLIENKNKSLFIGTFGQGLIEYDLISSRQKEWILRFPKLNSRAVSFIKSLLIDSKNNLWVGYWGSGLGRIDLKSGQYRLWITQPSNPSAISHTDVWSLIEDNLGRIWIGTHGGGLNLFEDKSGGIFHHWLQNDKNGLSSNNINVVCEAINQNLDEQETILWIGTSNGLNRFEIKNTEGSSNPFEIETTNTFYTVKDGLPDNNVNSIIEDKNGNLWLGTGSGISFFNMNNLNFTNFSADDGLNGTNMNPGSAAKLQNGVLLFGSKKGLNIFNPEEITRSSFKPSLVITDFQIFNQSVEIGKETPLSKSLLATKEIELSHSQNVFSFEFAALDFNSPKSIKYAYKMEGFDEDWIESGNRRFVTYTNLDPGRYIFKVKSTNADGIWTDNVKSLSIIINPPWWRTIWAYLLYVVLIVLGLIGIRRFELNRVKLRNELKLREVEVKQKTELEEIKARFYANLSHEFRTPLMLIKGPLEQLKYESSGNKAAENIDLIERNSIKLKELIDQLLELSQLEKSAVNLKARKTDLITLLKGLVSSFNSLANQKNISLDFNSEKEKIICWIDVDKFEKIINNLLLNALKFTSEGGKVEVYVDEAMKDGASAAEVKISDTGISIPKEKLNKIFDRYFQVEDSSQRSHGGSGIGLALVKEFVELHKWDISVESERGKGTTFSIKIPLEDDYLEPFEKIETAPDAIKTKSENDVQKKIEAKNVTNKNKVETTRNRKIPSDKKPSLLIVDDSEDVRIYLTNLLEDTFHISEAANGDEGIKAATEILPDLIISDIMMPSMDGLEFCARIKSEWQTSDIPVILLTAKASSESKLEGLETGADDYLTKPFESRELLIRINNLLEQRRRLKEKYSKSFDPLSEIKNLNTADTQFIKKTLDAIEKNIDKTNFNTEKLASLLFMSRANLHRKIISVAGQAPGELIRTIKLNRAAKYLIEGNLSVTQIAYEIGFSSPAQFTRAFSKQFNCLPSEFSINRKS